MAYKANTRNIALINADLADHEGTRRRSVRNIAIGVGIALVAGVAMVAFIVVVGVMIIQALVNAF